MSDDLKDPNHHWFETKLGDIYIGLRNRTSRLFIDHWGSSEIRTSGENCSYVERHWCLIWHHSTTDTSDKIVTLKNFESGQFLEHKNDSIRAVATRVTSTSQHWQRLPTDVDGYFAFRNVATGMVLSLSQQGIEANDDDTSSTTHQWRECDVGRGLVALQNRAFVCMLRQTAEMSIYASNMRIQGGNDLWKIERAMPVDLLENKPDQADVMKLFQLQEESGNNEDILLHENVHGEGPGWVIRPEEVVRQEVAFATGSFGSVYRAKWSNTDVVVKEIKAATGMEKKRFLKEVKLWSELHHDNIVPFYGASLSQDNLFVVSKLAENGTLNSYLKSVKGVAWRMMFQVAAGLQYLHDHKIIHGDLKGNNIVVSTDGTAMLTDFGFSFLDNGSCSIITRRDQLGALQWRAPEFVLNTAERPTYASDVYSLGMCIVAAVNGTEYPWGGNFDSTAVRGCLRNRGVRFEKPAVMTTAQWHLVKQMIAYEACDRPVLKTVLEELEKFAFDEEYDEKAQSNEENENNANTSCDDESFSAAFDKESKVPAKGVMGIVEKSWLWLSSMTKP
ncbi:hypothetical protein ON010_g9311 [Phytophthora cinnamomi]|nr:hypothetical protein ON010_g9311 [Phytophthora cinnamomi]